MHFAGRYFFILCVLMNAAVTGMQHSIHPLRVLAAQQVIENIKNNDEKTIKKTSHLPLHIQEIMHHIVGEDHILEALIHKEDKRYSYHLEGWKILIGVSAVLCFTSYEQRLVCTKRDETNRLFRGLRSIRVKDHCVFTEIAPESYEFKSWEITDGKLILYRASKSGKWPRADHYSLKGDCTKIKSCPAPNASVLIFNNSPYYSGSIRYKRSKELKCDFDSIYRDSLLWGFIDRNGRLYHDYNVEAIISPERNYMAVWESESVILYNMHTKESDVSRQIRSLTVAQKLALRLGLRGTPLYATIPLEIRRYYWLNKA